MNGLLHDGRRLAFAALLSAAAWLAATGSVCAQVGAGVSPGPLSKAHTALEGTDNCQSCHDPKQAIAAPKCLTCHTPIAERIAAKKGVHRDVTDGCEGCHVEHAGLDADLRPLDPKTFDHAAETGFALVGRHAPLARECARCHKTRSFLENRPACASCHQARDAHRGALGRECERCHTPEGWPSASRAFHKVGLFPLEGRHLTVACASCHINGVTRGTPTKCFDCHWVRRQDDPYQTRLGNQCEQCHRPTSWTAVNWNHAVQAGTPLSGQHRTLSCDSCHKDRRFMGGTVACSSCHMADYQRTAQPNHAAAAFPLNCEVCHQPSHTSWNQAVFSHAAFPLVGTHSTQPCASCHKNSVYKGTPRDCVGCHAADYQKTTSPNHAAAGFPTACEQCHKPTSTSWTGVPFNHSTYFPLVGLHATQACSACHKNNVYKGTPRNCVGCHAADYQRTTSPNHAAAGFPTTCEQCHQPTAPSWSSSGGFTHASVYPLVGTHATQACTSCHKNGVYKGTPRDCVGCHLANYQKTTNPNHAASGFPTACEQCHQPSAPSWSSSGGFNHASVYPLVGTHATQACASCHKNGVYKGTPRDCVGCHLANYQKTTNPNHAASGFPTACEQCHQPSAPSWSSSGGFNHASVYPLVGTHATQACASCHKNGVYKGTPRDCVGCHQTDYQQTTNPNHPAAGFPTTCEQCHQASAPQWTASFNHNQFYPLLGRHLQQPCSACHKNNVYKGTPTACVACHQTNYNQTANPNHAAAGFPTTCESCHKAGDTSWTQGVFNHTRFPITTGRHAGVACRTCHTTANNYQVFSCLTGCHSRADTDGDHSGNNNYRYDSAACYACHPTGSG